MNEEIAGSTDIITRTPFEVILLQAKIGMITGAVVAIPALLFSPGKRSVGAAITASSRSRRGISPASS